MKSSLRKKETIPKIFKKIVAANPNNDCFLFQDDRWSFEDVDNYSNRVANFLLESGYRKGDVIAVFSENCPQMVGLWLGMSKVGVVAALINFNLRDIPLAHCIKVKHK